MVRLSRAVLAAVCLLGGSPLHAAATKSVPFASSDAQTFVAWTRFLSGGTQTWATTHAPAFTPAVESAIWKVLKTDTAVQSLSNPMIQYLEWRRSLDPTRFAYYHPSLAPTLAQLLPAPSLPQTIPPPPSGSPASSSTPGSSTTGAQSVTPPAVPEPGSFAVAAAMTAWGIWWRRRMRKRMSR